MRAIPDIPSRIEGRSSIWTTSMIAEGGAEASVSRNDPDSGRLWFKGAMKSTPIIALMTLL